MSRTGNASPHVFCTEKLQRVDFATLMFVTCGLVYLQSEFAALTVGVLVYLLIERTNKTTILAFQKESGKQRKKVPSGSHMPMPVRQGNRIENQRTKLSPWKKIHAPVFHGKCFETQVQEFACRIAPTADGDSLVASLARMCQRLLSNLVPEAELMGFTTCDILQGTDFGLSNPEIDLVLTVCPKMLSEAWSVRCQNRPGSRGRPLPPPGKLSALALQKAVLRECTSDLVGTNMLKFRRSAFESLEPNVTLIAPPATTQRAVNIPVRFAVNAKIPLYNYALVSECGQMDVRAKHLILLVRRWAKFRGISQENHGFPTPYLWTLLVIHFLQNDKIDGNYMIPSLGAFKLLGGLVQGPRARHSEARSSKPDVRQESIAVMYQKFVSFCANRLAWDCGIVSLHGSVPASSGIAQEQNKKSIGVVRIEDPFDTNQTLNRHMTAVSVGRIREELQRAEELLEHRGTLTGLLEPWISPEHAELASGRIAGIIESEASRQGFDGGSAKWS